MREIYWGRSDLFRHRFLDERDFDSAGIDAVFRLFGAPFLATAPLSARRPLEEAGFGFEPVLSRIFEVVPPSASATPAAAFSAGGASFSRGDPAPAGLFHVAPQASGDPAAAAASRTATASIGGAGLAASTAMVTAPLAGVGRGADLVVLYSEDLQTSLVVDPATRQLLPGGAGDWMHLLDGRQDTLTLNGDFSAGVTLPGGPGGIDSLRLAPGNSYTLVANDDGLGRGGVLDVSGVGLGVGDLIDFDGSAETDGQFVFRGGDGADRFVGGSGDDLIYGLGGGDTLTGGAGADIFAYGEASESSGAGFDTLADFDPAEDRIDLPGEVSGFADSVEGGTLSDGSFDDDLAAALAGLGAGQAVLFTPDDGDHAGRTFLVVDGNGEEGYQPGEDFVFAIDNPPADLGGSTDIFI